MERYKIFVLLLFVNIFTFMIRFALSVAILARDQNFQILPNLFNQFYDS